MAWIQFAFTAIIIVLAAVQLAKYGDVIAIRTGLGGMFVGLILLAGATSLPELLTSISSVNQGIPNLAAGNLLGSNMFNMFMLALLDLLFRKERLLRKSALRHAVSGSLAVFIIGLAVFFIMAKIQRSLGWVGWDSIILMVSYIIAIRLIQSNENPDKKPVAKPEIPADMPSLGRGVLGFAIAAGVLVLITPLMVRSSATIAEQTGLGTTFVGSTLVALVTSLPELATTVAALRIGADDMAISNLFGSNLFNMFALGLTDVFYTGGNFLSMIDPAFLLVGMLGLLMTSMGLIGNLARLERRILFIEVDALALMALYFGGLYFLYLRGVGG
jgi:cation:H+ antiporter